MKNLFILIIPLLLILPGCGTIDKTLLQRTDTISYSTNETGSVVATTNAAFSIAPSVQTALQTGQTVSPLIPAPYGTAVELTLASATALLGLYARKRTQQVNEHKSALETAENIVSTLVTAIELGGDPATKQKASALSGAFGVPDALDKRVQEISATMPPAPK